MKRLLVTVIVGLALISLAAGLWTYRVLWGVRSQRTVNIEVVEGMATRKILRLLQREELLPSVTAGRLYLRTRAGGRSMRFGHYVLPAGSRPVDALEQILEGRVEMFSITVVEGTDAITIGEEFSGLGVGSGSDWEALVGRVEWIHALAPAARSLEGFLFPDTYDFAVGISAEAAARHLVDRFREVWSEEAAHIGEPWGTPLEIVTLASLVEAETSVPEERARVAGVYHNRLRRGMLLQCDPTVVFALKRREEWTGRLLRIHWEVDDPYNTYRYPGLPPGPINSPGRAAIVAALDPEPTPFLYFVARPGGGHTFSRTLAEHNRAVDELLRSRR